MATRTSTREQAKADRAQAILRASAALFAARGFDAVTLEDVGAAVGVTGPAIYRHFRSKQDLLGAILLRTSEDLLEGGRAAVAGGTGAALVPTLVRFHVAFAVTDADVIRVQDRDLERLAPDARQSVRRLQRKYVELWVDALTSSYPDADRAELRVRALACFGLINSTAHSLRRSAVAGVPGILEAMALAALRA